MNRKQTSALEYQRRIQRALTYIRENLDKRLTLKDVAGAACFSPYHFHRIFSAVMREPLGEYITRKKLERAAIRLAYSPEVRVSDLALEYGYASVSGFSKAFCQWFGCRPTEIKRIRQRLDSGNGKLQTKYERSVESGRIFGTDAGSDPGRRFREIDRQVKIVSIESFTVCYLTSPDGYDLAGIHRIWAELAERLADKGIDIRDCKRFAISHDHPGLTPDSQCRYDACVRLPEPCNTELPFAATRIPAGRYAVYRVRGPETAILDRFLEFCAVWLPRSGYELDNFPVLEHYPVPACGGEVTVELWYKIRRLPLF